MPRKGKSGSSGTNSAANKYSRWRSLVRELLVAEWDDSADVDGIAATVVGMFDAGAPDAEVAAFLHSQELLRHVDSPLTDEARMALVRKIHESAALQ
jgi:hypothetical protein